MPKPIIFLIGMPACGKTTYAKMFAETYQINCIDLDEYLEKSEGKTISEIFEAGNEDSFRELERDALIEICDKTNRPTIISCGGGTPCFFDNIEVLNKNGITIYIRCDIQLLLKNISGISPKPRPLLDKMDTIIIKKKLENLIFTRNYYYHKARYTLDNVDNPDDLLLQIYNIAKNDNLL